MSSTLRERFAHLLTPPGNEAVPVEQPEETREERESREDLRRCVGTQAFSQLRRAVVSEIQGCSPNPAGGIESAAAAAYIREGLERVLRRLDTMLASAGQE